jgi:cytidyltransferase-like protein
MIVQTRDLPKYRHAVTMVDGGFDPLHPGHVAYFREAARLGSPVLCNVSGDHYVARKHPPFLFESERVEIIDAIRFVDYTHLSKTSTEKILNLLQPRYYAKGKDWEGRLPAEQVAICERGETEVVFLDTVIESSTQILERYMGRRDGAG